MNRVVAIAVACRCKRHTAGCSDLGAGWCFGFCVTCWNFCALLPNEGSGSAHE